MMCTRRRDESAAPANPRNPSPTLLRAVLSAPNCLGDNSRLDAAPALADEEPTAHGSDHKAAVQRGGRRTHSPGCRFERWAAAGRSGQGAGGHLLALARL